MRGFVSARAPAASLYIVNKEHIDGVTPIVKTCRAQRNALKIAIMFTENEISARVFTISLNASYMLKQRSVITNIRM